MWRKIRRFYWYRRDRGLGKQTIAMAAMLLLMVIILAGVIAKSIVPQKALRNEAEIPANTATGPAISIHHLQRGRLFWEKKQIQRKSLRIVTKSWM